VNDGDKNEGEPRKPGLRLSTTEVAPSLPHPSSYARRLARPLAVVGGLSQRTRRVSAVLFLFLSFRFSLFLFRFVHSVSSFVSSDVRSDSVTRPRRHVTAPLKEPIALQDYSNSEHVPVARSSRCVCFDMCVGCHIGLPHRCRRCCCCCCRCCCCYCSGRRRRRCCVGREPRPSH